MGLGHINKASEGTKLLYSCNDTNDGVADISAGAGADVYSFSAAEITGTPIPTNVTGLIGGAKSFPTGPGRWMRTGVATGDFKSNNTFEAWVRHNGANTGSIYFFSLGSSTNQIIRLGMALVGGIQKFRFVYHSTSGNLTFDTTVGIPSNTWTHVAATRSQTGVDVNLYINGALNTAFTAQAAVSTNTNVQTLCFGGTDSTSGPWVGEVDDLAMSTSIRSAAAILETYRRGKGILASKAIGFGASFNWDLNRGFGAGKMRK